ncbi:hypothetical protein HJ158_25015 [Vibrio parahaemolyticus]|nr:hypothetical protein [Vibrio parahaemolyticus]
MKYVLAAVCGTLLASQALANEPAPQPKFDQLYSNPQFTVIEAIPNIRYEIILSGETGFAPEGWASAWGDAAVRSFNTIDVAYDFSKDPLVRGVASSGQEHYYSAEGSWGWVQPLATAVVPNVNAFAILGDEDVEADFLIENEPTGEAGMYRTDSHFFIQFEEPVNFDPNNVTVIMHTDRKAETVEHNMFITTFEYAE